MDAVPFLYNRDKDGKDFGESYEGVIVIISATANHSHSYLLKVSFILFQDSV